MHRQSITTFAHALLVIELGASTIFRSIAISALVLAGFALAGTALVAVTNDQTRERIAANEKAQLVKALAEVVDPARYNNSPDADTLVVRDRTLLGTEDDVVVYRARQDGEPVAVVLTAVAPNGYSGAINLLVGVNADGSLAGVRVTSHRETPGLGDGIEIQRSPWVKGFDGRSLENISESGWRVKKDGGEFDQFTGATITPRAVVAAVHRALQFYRSNRETLFNEHVAGSVE